MNSLVRCALRAASLAVSVRASTILDTLDPQAYRDEAAWYPSVGKVTGSGFSGSGVLISDRWVLTAGHVSQNKQAGGVFHVAGVEYQVESTILHPSFSLAGSSISYDLGLLHLAAPVTGVGAAEMLALSPPGSILGKEATWVGVGFTGTGLTGAQASPIELRAFTNLIEFYGTQYGLTATSFVADFDNPAGTSNRQDSDPAPTRLEGAVAPGDSGGGVFITENGVRRLVGITSYSGAVSPATSNSKYGGLSGAVDLQQFYPWIFEQTGIAAVPEPGIAGLAALGGALALRRRRIPAAGRF
jgi:hypothetical protein